MIDFLDKFINPIHLLGLRSYVRTKRFLYIFNFSVILMVGVMLFGFFTMSLNNTSAAEIGKSLFVAFSVVQYAIIGLIFPAFSCTGIIAEKQEKTYDLLVTANLTSSQIVWGKFLSGFTHCAIFLISSLPIVTVAFLFGGITPTLIAATYCVLFAYSAFVIMSCLAISGFYKSVTRSIIASYLLIIIFNICFTFPIFALLFDYLYYTEITQFFRAIGGYSSLNAFMTMYIVPPFLFISIMLFPYLIAKNALKMDSHNRSTSLRVYFFVIGTAVLTIFFIYYINSMITFNLSKIPYDAVIVLGGSVYGTIGVLCIGATIGFSTENPTAEKFVTNRLHTYLKSRKLLKIFSWSPIRKMLTPGSYSGTTFTNATCLFWLTTYIVVNLITFEYWSLNTTSYTARKYGNLEHFYLILPALVVFSFVFFLSSLGTFLSFRTKSKGWRRCILFGFVLFVFVFLPIYALFYIESRRSFQSAFFNLQYLSPSLNFALSLLPISDISGRYYDFRILQIPIYYYHCTIYIILAVLLNFSNYISIKKRQKILVEQEQEIINLEQFSNTASIEKKENKQEEMPNSEQSSNKETSQ